MPTTPLDIPIESTGEANEAMPQTQRMTDVTTSAMGILPWDGTAGTWCDEDSKGETTPPAGALS